MKVIILPSISVLVNTYLSYFVFFFNDSTEFFTIPCALFGTLRWNSTDHVLSFVFRRSSWKILQATETNSLQQKTQKLSFLCWILLDAAVEDSSMMIYITHRNYAASVRWKWIIELFRWITSGCRKNKIVGLNMFSQQIVRVGLLPVRFTDKVYLCYLASMRSRVPSWTVCLTPKSSVKRK